MTDCDECRFSYPQPFRYADGHYNVLNYCGYYNIRSELCKEVCTLTDEEKKAPNFNRTVQPKESIKKNKRNKRKSRK